MTEERNIGEEILEGIRQIKRGETGRVTCRSPTHEIREHADRPLNPGAGSGKPK